MLFLKQKEQLLARLDPDLVNDTTGDEVDIAQGIVINEMVERLSAREKELMTRINNALDRIEDGSFGKCEECENQINEARLLAIPHCTLCISCAEHKEAISKQYRK